MPPAATAAHHRGRCATGRPAVADHVVGMPYRPRGRPLAHGSARGLPNLAGTVADVVATAAAVEGAAVAGIAQSPIVIVPTSPPAPTRARGSIPKPPSCLMARDASEAILALRRRAKCARQESNLRPFAPEANALSPELRARSGTSVAPVELDRSRRDAAARRDVHDLARVGGRGRRRPGRGAARRRLGLRRGGADRALRRVGRVGARVARASVELGDDPFALDEIDGAPAAGRAGRPRGARRTRSTTCRAS